MVATKTSACPTRSSGGQTAPQRGPRSSQRNRALDSNIIQSLHASFLCEDVTRGEAASLGQGQFPERDLAGSLQQTTLPAAVGEEVLEWVSG